MDRNRAEQLISSIATFNGIDPDLAISFAHAESNFDEYAVRHEPNWRYFTSIEIYAARNRISQDTEKVLQACSFGLMQVMGTVARELGFKDNLLMLTRPEIGVKYGCFKIQELMKKYSKVDDVIAAYNAGTPKRDEKGHYLNAAYVTKVRSIFDDRKVRA